MSVRGDASADKLTYSTVANLPNAATHSVCGWVKIKVDTNSFATVFYLNGNNADGEVFFSTQADGVTLELTDSASNVVLGALTLDTWYFVGYVRTNTSRSVYIGTEAGGSLTKTSNSETKNRNTAYGASGEIALFNNAYSEFLNGELTYARIWSGVALSDSEMDAEWRSTTPVRTSNLWADYRLASAATAGDDSGSNNYDLTVAGSFADGGANPTPPASGSTQIILRHPI